MLLTVSDHGLQWKTCGRGNTDSQAVSMQTPTKQYVQCQKVSKLITSSSCLTHPSSPSAANDATASIN